MPNHEPGRESPYFYVFASRQQCVFQQLRSSRSLDSDVASMPVYITHRVRLLQPRREPTAPTPYVIVRFNSLTQYRLSSETENCNPKTLVALSRILESFPVAIFRLAAEHAGSLAPTLPTQTRLGSPETNSARQPQPALVRPATCACVPQPPAVGLASRTPCGEDGCGTPRHFTCLAEDESTP